MLGPKKRLKGRDTMRKDKVRKADKKGKVEPLSLTQILRKLPLTLT